MVLKFGQGAEHLGIMTVFVNFVAKHSVKLKRAGRSSWLAVHSQKGKDLFSHFWVPGTVLGTLLLELIQF